MPNFTYSTSFFQRTRFSSTPYSSIHKLLLWLMIFLGLTQQATAQAPSINWQKTLGGSNDDYAYAMTASSDGGSVVVGYTLSTNGDVTGNHGSFDMWVVKLDGNGNKIWQKTLGGSNDEYAHAVTATLDGGYVVAGFTESNNGDVTGNHGGRDFWVVKLDGNGNLVWQKTLGGSAYDVAHAVKATSDGGYVVGGYTFSTNGDVTGNHGTDDWWIVKLDGSGNLVWQKTLGGSLEDRAAAITVTADGNYVIAGHSYSNDGNVTGHHIDNGTPDYWVVKLDGAGNLIWQKSLGGSSVDYAEAVTTTSDGGYVVAGFTQSINGDVTGNHGSSDYWVVKLDGLGNLVWQKALGGTGQDNCYALTSTADEGYVVAGNSSSTNGDVTGNHGDVDYWVVKLDGSGNLVWQKTLGGTSFDGAMAVTSRTNGNLVVAGYTTSNNGDVTGNHGNVDFWVVTLGTGTPIVSKLAASHDPVCAGKPVLLTASISNITDTYSYTISNGASINVQGTSSTPAFSQTLIVSGSGPQSFTLLVKNAAGSMASLLTITVVNDGNCPIPTPCASVQSGDWSNPTTWLCGHEPTVDDIVILNPSHVVTILNSSAQAQRIRFNDGRIRYASTGTKVFVKGE